MTNIQWTEKTWNPVRGCSRVSKGCESCYAETFAGRFSGPGKPWEGFVKKVGGKSRWTGRVELIPQNLENPLKRKQPTTYFVNSMSDLFHEALPFEHIAAVFGVMAGCPQHTFQVLTKRPDRMVEFFSWVKKRCEGWANGEKSAPAFLGQAAWKWGDVPASLMPMIFLSLPWPLPNVMLGVSVENQPTADERIARLLQVPAAVWFVSAEPLLEEVDLRSWLGPGSGPGWVSGSRRVGQVHLPSLSWVIVGGESGPNARPCNIDWIRSIVRQCQNADVPVFVKQLGALPIDLMDGQFISFQQWVNKARSWIGGTGAVTFDYLGRQCRTGRDFARARDEDAFPVAWYLPLQLRDPKGGNPQEWPEDLRVREFPRATQTVTP